MDYDANLRVRIEECLENEPGVTVQRMFGGVCFMLNGHMLCGIARDQLVCRVGPGAYEKSLRLQHAKPMDFTGKPLAGMVYVDSAGVTNLSDLQKWLDRCIDFVKSLPSKDEKSSTGSKGKKTVAKKATKKVATNKKTATKKATKKVATNKKTATKKVAQKKATKAATKKKTTAKKKTVAKKATKKVATNKKTATKKVAQKKATKAGAKKKTTTKKKTVAKKATKKSTTTKKTVAKKATKKVAKKKKR